MQPSNSRSCGRAANSLPIAIAAPAPFVVTLALGVVTLAFGGCRVPYRSVPPTAGADPATIPAASQSATDALTMDVTTPTHEVEARDGSRMYLLDLYQKAMDEKDALVLEVKSMQAALEHEEGVRKAAEAERDTLALKLQAAEQREQDLHAELSELVARLTTAQIRRLEAEKMLLESKIEEHKAAADAMPNKQTSAPAKTPQSTPMSGHKP